MKLKALKLKACPICGSKFGSSTRGWCQLCLLDGPTYPDRNGATIAFTRDFDAMEWAEWAARRARAAERKRKDGR